MRRGEGAAAELTGAGAARPGPPTRRRAVLAAACGVHALHDGLTDTLYVLLPLWRAEFGLGYAAVGMLRGLYSAAMASLQIPSALLAERIGGRVVLALGTALAALGYLFAGASGSAAGLALAIALGGCGSSVQHPVASSYVARAYEEAGPKPRRLALAAYNFAGDLGKTGLPALVALLLVVRPWRSVALLVAALGAVAAVLVWLALRGAPALARRPGAAPASPAGEAAGAAPRGAFPALVAIGVLDSAARSGFLTFLPFVLLAKGGDTRTVGLALALAFAGGAAGKLACGWLGARIGAMPVVWLTEALTAAAILAVAWVPLTAALALLPLLGAALNGTSSVLYGTVPELVPAQRQGRAFGVFYSATIGSSALAPAVYGALADGVGARATMAVIAAAVLATLPLSWALRPVLAAARE